MASVHVTTFQLENWRQFGAVNLDLSSQVTILTGVNGSGKTTLLKLLAYFTGEQFSFLSTPRMMRDDKGYAWYSGVAVGRRLRKLLNFDEAQPANRHIIGQLAFSNGQSSRLFLPYQTDGAQTQVEVENLVATHGFFVSSHRPDYYYAPVASLGIAKKSRRNAYNEYIKEIRRSYSGNTRVGLSSILKNALLNWGYVGFGSEVAPRDPELMNNFLRFQQILRDILPESLGFEKYEIRSGSEIVFVCKDEEDFILETASGGIVALIHLAWLIFTYSDDTPFTVLIDEAENHLHPSLQRILLPNLSRAFPYVRFVVSTHSPLVVNSVKGSSVYALHYDGSKVISSKLDFDKDARSAADILDQVLGVPVTLPTWAEHEYGRIVNEYLNRSPNEVDLEAFTKELRAAGLGSFALTGIEDFLSKRK
jgi:energy-coupling factor transporter ATP-binding protein EcfA2